MGVRVGVVGVVGGWLSIREQRVYKLGGGWGVRWRFLGFELVVLTLFRGSVRVN